MGPVPVARWCWLEEWHSVVFTLYNHWEKNHVFFSIQMSDCREFPRKNSKETILTAGRRDMNKEVVFRLEGGLPNEPKNRRMTCNDKCLPLGWWQIGKMVPGKHDLPMAMEEFPMFFPSKHWTLHWCHDSQRVDQGQTWSTWPVRCFDGPPEWGELRGASGCRRKIRTFARGTWNSISESGINFLVFTCILKDRKVNVLLVRGLEPVSSLLSGRKIGWKKRTFFMICQDNTWYVPLTCACTNRHIGAQCIHMHAICRNTPACMLYTYGTYVFKCVYTNSLYRHRDYWYWIARISLSR